MSPPPVVNLAEANLLISSLPEQIELRKPFTFRLAPLNANSLPLELRFEDSDGVRVKPLALTFNTVTPQEVEATVERAQGGIAELVLFLWDRAEIRTTLNVGFSANLDFSPMGRVVAGGQQQARVALVGHDARELSLGAPVHVQIRGSGLTLRYAGSNWGRELQFLLPRGSTGTPAFDLLAEGLSSKQASVDVAISADPPGSGVPPLRQQVFSVQMSSHPLLQAGVTIFGGLLAVGYSLLSHRTSPIRRSIPKMFGASLAASLLAFVVADWNVLGIKAESTSLRAFAGIGFLFSYFGIDGILRRFVSINE